jgi:hypothetical protein
LTRNGHECPDKRSPRSDVSFVLPKMHRPQKRMMLLFLEEKNILPRLTRCSAL